MSWEESLGPVRERLDAMHAARETALPLCRKVVQCSSRAIRSAHRSEFDPGRELLAEAWRHAGEARRALAPHPELLFAGYLHDAEKEVVEAAVVLAALEGTVQPGWPETPVAVASFVHGVCEAASELRRSVLDALRRGDNDRATRLVAFMEIVSDDLATLDYPDALTSGLRRAADSLRAVLERTRADLTMTLVQAVLRAKLEAIR